MFYYLNRRIKQQDLLIMKKITGRVLQEEGQPLFGVTISTNNTEVSTDMNGYFTVYISENSNLILKYPGYRTQNIKPSTTVSINIIMIHE